MKDELIITLVSEGPQDKGPPIELRWRAALKLLLRRCGLRCRDIRLTRGDRTRDEERERALIAAAEAMTEARDRGDPWAALLDPRVETAEELMSDATPEE